MAEKKEVSPEEEKQESVSTESEPKEDEMTEESAENLTESEETPAVESDEVELGEAEEKDSVEKWQAESRENYQRYLRAVADLENYRRRALREKEELRKYATASLIEDLLPALDNLELGLLSAEGNESGKSIAQGFIMVVQQLKSILQQHGLEEVNPEGETFDPHRHEATGHEASEEVEEGKVIRVNRKGYLLQGRLLRPAMVVVSGGKE